jgi:uncharacterized protein YdaU (DUF1376 family)
MSKRWYKRCGADFIHGTMGLSLEEKGAYSLCLDLIYDHGGPVPDDPRWLSGICGVSLRKWASIRQRLISVGKLVAEDGHLMNARAVFEIASAKLSSENLAERGSKGGRKRAENACRTKENNNLGEAGLKHLEEDKKRTEGENTPAAVTSYSDSASWLRGLVGEHPVAVATDIHVMEALLSEGITRDDMAAGISAALKSGYRPKYWSKLVGWARRSAQERLTKAPVRALPNHRPLSPQEQRDAHIGLLQAFKRSPGSWSPNWGPRPDELGCIIDADLLAEFGYGAQVAA